jgi:uncharacterized membrane protein
MNKPAKIFFTGSLILNVLFLGVAAGGLFYDDHKPPRPWERTKAELAPETLTIIKATFKGKKEEIVPLFKEARTKKQAMKAIISAPELDERAYDTLADELKVLNGKLMDHRLTTIKSIFSQLSQEERVKMAEHTVEKMLGNPPQDRQGGVRNHGEFKRFPNSGINSSERMHKKGAIEVEGDIAPFDASRPAEDGTNHEE